MPEQNLATGKPPLEQVVDYVEGSVEYYISKFAMNLPSEQKDEIRQNAYLRVCEAYPRLDEALGWKSFVQNHCRGSVLDYIRHGNGFEESRQSLKDKDAEGDAAAETDGSYEAQKFNESLRVRVTVMGDDGDRKMDAEEIAGIHGIFSKDDSGTVFNPIWRLVARMASVDDDIHLLAKLLLGFTKPELARRFDVSRERMYQRLKEFFERIDSPEKYHDPWVTQTIYAFGLCDRYNMDPVDNGLGWNFKPVNLIADDSISELPSMGQTSFTF